LYPIANPFCVDQKIMLLNVHEDDPYEVRLRLGAGLQQMSKEFTFRNVSYVAGGVFLVKNPFNYADQFRIDAEYTHGEQTFAARYTRPWIFNLPIKGSFELYATQYLQPGLRHNQKNIYSFVQQGFLLGFNYRRRVIDAQLNTGIEWMKTNVVDKINAPFFTAEITRALNFEPLLVDRKIPYALFEPTLVIDRLNNKLNPTHGSLGLFSVKGMFPLRLLRRNSFFLRIFIDQSVYLPVQKSVFAFRLRAGHIFYKDFKNVMPAERFYMGGANSIRSYETDMCPPLGTIVNHNGKTCFVPQGARSMITFNAEWRMPLYQNFWMTVFQDLGALSNNHFADIRAQNILAGTGFGLRYNTPIGPLRFDIAWKWHRPDHAISRYCWFLSFGNAF
jgi:outer membrane protein assembly factor BamA